MNIFRLHISAGTRYHRYLVPNLNLLLHLRTCDYATINDLRRYLPDHMCKKYKQDVWLNLILWLIQFENSFRSGQMIYGSPDTYILQNIIHHGVWCMVGFWHWHIPTFIITDISPPWWDFVMVGICWVTIIMIVMIIVSMILLIQICACGSPRCCSTEWNHSVKPRSTSKDNFDNWIRIVMIKINRTKLEEQYGQAK